MARPGAEAALQRALAAGPGRRSPRRSGRRCPRSARAGRRRRVGGPVGELAGRPRQVVVRHVEEPEERHVEQRAAGTAATPTPTPRPSERGPAARTAEPKSRTRPLPLSRAANQGTPNSPTHRPSCATAIHPSDRSSVLSTSTPLTATTMLKAIDAADLGENQPDGGVAQAPAHADAASSRRAVSDLVGLGHRDRVRGKAGATEGGCRLRGQRALERRAPGGGPRGASPGHGQARRRGAGTGRRPSDGARRPAGRATSCARR